MKTTKKRAFLAMVAIIAIAFIGCKDEPDTGTSPKNVAADFRQTYTGGKYQANAQDSTHKGLTIIVGENTITISGGDLISPIVISSVSSAGGGTISTDKYTGSWAYIYENETKIGFVGKYIENGTTYLAVGCGLEAKNNKSNFESGFETIQDFAGVADYPSFANF